jgi:hypothetical protein
MEKIPPFFRNYVDTFTTPVSAAPGGRAVYQLGMSDYDGVDVTVTNLNLTLAQVDLYLAVAEAYLNECRDAGGTTITVPAADLKRWRIALDTLRPEWGATWLPTVPKSDPEIFGLWLQAGCKIENGIGSEYQYPAFDDEPRIPVLYSGSGTPYHTSVWRPTILFGDVDAGVSVYRLGAIASMDDATASDPSALAIYDNSGFDSTEILTNALSKTESLYAAVSSRARQCMTLSGVAKWVPETLGLEKLAMVPYQHFIDNSLAILGSTWLGRPFAA